MGIEHDGIEEVGIDHQDRLSNDSIGLTSPVKQYALASILIVLGALVAVNFVSSRVERESVISRLETEALEPARVSSSRIVEQIRLLSGSPGAMLLTLPNNTATIDGIVLNAVAGQQIARVDILDVSGEIIYSTDPFYIGDQSEYAQGPVEPTSEYVGAAAISGLDGHTALIEAVITRVPLYEFGRAPQINTHESTMVMYRDVSEAIDVATSAGARFRFWMVIGVMTVVFASLMIVVMRGHRAQTDASDKLRTLLIHEHILVSELDKRNADLKTADEARLRLLSVVTHELGNPLTSISAFVNMLAKNRDKTLSGRELDMINAISRGESQMRVLLQDLLDLSRVEANELELSLNSVSLNEVVEGVVESMNPVVAEKFQVITAEYRNGYVEVNGDHVRLNQVVTNLVSNASKYSPINSTIEIKVAIEGSRSVIEVGDRGIGISTDDQQNLFTPFFRADNAETRQVHGTGLGLVICKQIVEQHGGRLTLNSIPGRGTTIRVEIPVTESYSQFSNAA